MIKAVKKILIFILFVILIFSLLSCKTIQIDIPFLSKAQTTSPSEAPIAREYTEEEIFQKIIELVQVQEIAIQTVDTELMEATINPIDSWLRLEIKHLVADQKLWPVLNYARSVSDIKKEGAYYIGTVVQGFIFQGLEKQSTEQRYFMFEDGKAYDMGTVLEKAKTGLVFLAFPEGQYEFATGLGDVTNEYVTAVNEMWGMSFEDPISIKIYDDKDVFSYSIKLSMPDWVGGWYERGESIKTYLYDTTRERYEYLVRHEATHMMLSAATNDNASYWMQEGFATTLPGYVTDGKLAINRIETVKEALRTGRLPSFEEHAQTNIETLTDIFDVRLYYGYSSAMVIYLLEKIDDVTRLKFFKELETYPYISLTMGEKVYDTQFITEKCLKKATGKTFEQFYAGFEDWLKAKLS